MDFFKRIDTTKIYPPFLTKCQALIEACHAEGKDFYAISGFRSAEEQEKLYAIGRTTDAGRPPVTYAKPFESLHNFGLAIDFTLDGDLTRDGLQPVWKNEEYQILGDKAKELGLVPGFYFRTLRDAPHIQMRLSNTVGFGKEKEEAILKAKLIEAYKTGGLNAVWAVIPLGLV